MYLPGVRPAPNAALEELRKAEQNLPTVTQEAARLQMALEQAREVGK